VSRIVLKKEDSPSGFSASHYANRNFAHKSSGTGMIDDNRGTERFSHLARSVRRIADLPGVHADFSPTTYQGRKLSFRGSHVCSLYILVAEALDLILSILLIEADSSSSHNLTSALTVGIELHLKITKRIIGGAPIVV
jgi:hypothetical protein